MADEYEIHKNRRPDKAYISPSILTGDALGPPRRFRIAHKAIDSQSRHEFVREAGEYLVRVTPGGRQEVVVKFYEDDRSIFGITLQRFTLETGKPQKQSFSFFGEEITRFIEFLLNVCRVRLPNSEKLNVSDDAFRRMLLSPDRFKDLSRRANRPSPENSVDTVRQIPFAGFARHLLANSRNTVARIISAALRQSRLLHGTYLKS